MKNKEFNINLMNIYKLNSQKSEKSTKILINSAIAGSGKTEDIKNHLIHLNNKYQKTVHFVVYGSIDNCAEKANVYTSYFEDVSDIACIHSLNKDNSVVNDISTKIHEHTIKKSNENLILFITSSSLALLEARNILEDVDYTLTLDEVYEPYIKIEENCNGKNTNNFFKDHVISCGLETTKDFVILKPKQEKTFGEILKKLDAITNGLKQTCEAIANANKEAIMEKDMFDKIINGEALKYAIYSFNKSNMFIHSKENYIAAAFFEKTSFAKCYRNVFEYIDVTDSNKTHHNDGSRHTINYLSEKHVTSYRNKQVDALTNKTVVDNIITCMAKNFPDSLIFVNKDKYTTYTKSFLKENTMVSDTNVTGLNHLSHSTNLMYLATRNPSYTDYKFAEEVFGISKQELMHTRYYNCYQCLMRGNSREKDSSQDVTWFVLDKDVATFLESLFSKDNLPSVNYLKNDFYDVNNNFISKESKNTKNLLFKNNKRREDKKVCLFNGTDNIKFNEEDTVKNIFSFIKKSQKIYFGKHSKFTNLQINNSFMAFEGKKTEFDKLKNILKEYNLNYLIKVSKTGSKFAVAIPTNTVITSSLMKIVQEFFIDTFGFETMKYVSFFQKTNNTRYIEENKCDNFNANDLLNFNEFRQFVAASIHENISVKPENVISYFTEVSDFNEEVIENIQQIMNFPTKDYTVNYILKKLSCKSANLIRLKFLSFA